MTSPQDDTGRSSASDSVMEVDPVEAVMEGDSIVEVDPDGNLILLVGAQLPDKKDSPSSFRVCASALRRSSPVWKSMLFGPWKESKPASGTWSVDLPEDDPDALEVLLNIVHANFPLVPYEPDLLLLEGVLRLANKYDMVKALRPWSQAWLDVAKGSSGEENGRRMLSVVYVGRELGQVELQMNMMQKLVVEAANNENGQLVTKDGFALVDDGSDLFAEILGLQQDVLKALPAQLNEVIRALPFGSGRCVRTDDKSLCNFIMLGSIFKRMAHARLSVSLNLVADADESIAELSTSIRFIAEGMTALTGHQTCNPAA
ncbi:hypothetical protein CTRI78_v002771 [Colletotrichum trifolii]|uniref:BTB domain-containing protein n=1 Tax=Colletotrichum trifolii TaxID=5466 RepID=A0A4R8RKT7_COLTR|nr:hypothetical protein CTRI78_v002771 [Colletotrichum trifolii]